jgi:hypothetical protein
MAVLNQSQLQQILRQAGWPADVIPLMSAIGMAESSGRTTAVNNRPGREYSVGLWQINLLAHREYTAAQMQDPLQNARAALAIYRREGVTAWGSYTNGRYRSYLMDAQTAAASPATSSVIPESLITPDNAKIYIALAIGALLALKILRD